MCGRFSLFATPEEIANLFSVPLTEADSALCVGPRYNVAPTNEVAVVRQNGDRDGRELARLRWGLVPYWAKELGVGPLMINARAETVARKPAFREPFRSRRCLVIADGFFEWKKLLKGKQPYYFQVDGGALFAFAGIWDVWLGGGAEKCESCAIITTTANDVARPVHERMPVILDEDCWETWLHGNRDSLQPHEELESLLRPFPAERMCTFPVSTIVNSPKNDVPECVVPYGTDA